MMNTKENRKNELAALDKLINEITVDAYGDNEQLWAFRQAFEGDVILEFGARCNADLKPAADTF